MLDKRHGKRSEAAAGSGNMRVLVRHPAQVEAANPQPEKPVEPLLDTDAKRLLEEMSKSLWSSLNPGYIQQEPRKLRSVAAADYVWNEGEVCLGTPAGIMEFAGLYMHNYRFTSLAYL